MRISMLTPFVIACVAIQMTAEDATAYYSPSMGRFLSRDPIGELAMMPEPFRVDVNHMMQGGRFIERDRVLSTTYVDGGNLYQAYFVPNMTDPMGLTGWSFDNPARWGDPTLPTLHPPIPEEPEPQPHMCDMAHWSTMSGMNCLACCIYQNTPDAWIQGAVVGGGAAARPPIGKSPTWIPGQASSQNYWVHQGLRNGWSRGALKTARTIGRIGLAGILIEGAWDAGVECVCAVRCGLK